MTPEIEALWVATIALCSLGLILMGYWFGARGSDGEVDRLHEEVRFLRGQFVERRKHEQRMDRLEHGTSEVAPEEKDPLVVPERIQILCDMFPGRAGIELLAEAKRQKVAGRSWMSIEREMRGQMISQDPRMADQIEEAERLWAEAHPTEH